jgi:hypothetical protein
MPPPLLVLVLVLVLVPPALPAHTTHHLVDTALLRARTPALAVALGPVTKRGPVLA